MAFITPLTRLYIQDKIYKHIPNSTDIVSDSYWIFVNPLIVTSYCDTILYKHGVQFQYS